jgi:ATP-dependent protease ClpP protease subunit
MFKKMNIDDSDDEDSSNETITVKRNKVMFHANVNRENSFKLIECLDKAKEYVVIHNIHSEFDEISNIYLHIFSDGGEVYCAMSIIDYILKSKIPIITVNEGCVASSGVLISLAGEERYIRKNAYMLIHEIRSGCMGKYSECQDDMENNDIIMEQVKNYMNERCDNKLLRKKLDKVLKHDNIWNAEKCLKYGLVDKIV